LLFHKKRQRVFFSVLFCFAGGWWEGEKKTKEKRVGEQNPLCVIFDLTNFAVIT